MNYQKVKKDYERATYLLSVYDALKSCGIPEKLVHHFAPFSIYSGYKMGELTEIKCNGLLIVRYDDRELYRGSAKRFNCSAAHGYTCVNFSKKNLRKFIDLSAELSTEEAKIKAYETTQKRHDLLQEIKALIWGAVEEETTKHKKGSYIYLSWRKL
jgi:hypothetical protein